MLTVEIEPSWTATTLSLEALGPGMLYIQTFHALCKSCFSLLCRRIQLTACAIRVICTPFPTHRLASFAMQALRVDAELSPLVRRSFSVVGSKEGSDQASGFAPDGSVKDPSNITGIETRDANEDKTVLKTRYEAATNRMLRVAVNGFMESLALVIDVMENLDVDVLGQEVESDV